MTQHPPMPGDRGTMTTTSTPPNPRVRSALAGIRARITHEDAGGLDFELDGIGGVARERGGLLRISYFLAFDPDPCEGARFITAHDRLPDAELQLIDAPDGSALRLLTELPFEDHDRAWATAHTARAMHAAWLNRQEPGRDLATTLGAAGIAVPPLGPAADNHLYTYGSWSWGSRYHPPFLLYMFEVGLVTRHLVESGPVFALSHAGHGINSYGLNLVTTGGPVAAFVQHGYGGVYTGPVRSLIDINATYARLHVLLGATRQIATDEVRWLLLYSQFRDVLGIVDLDKIRHGEPSDDAFEAVETEADLFETMAARLNLRSIDFGTAGSVSW
jgi:hypothetical protein